MKKIYSQVPRYAAVLGVSILFSEFQLSHADGIEEITVTAQKREQNLQDVPMSITAIGAEEMTALNLGDSGDIANHTPGLNWGGTAGKSRPVIFLRGVGNSDFQSAANSPVAIYQDGTFQGNSFGLSALLMDLERVEVLRGPQGTLWGKNTTAGLLNFVPNKAKVGEEVNGRVSIGYAEFDSYDFEAAIGVPLSEKAAARVVVAHNSTDGAFDADGPGVDGDIGGWEWSAVRGNLVFEPTDKLSIGATVTYSDLNGEPRPSKSLGTLDPANPLTFVGPPPIPPIQNPCPLPNAGRLGTGCSDSFGYVASGDAHESEPNARGTEEVENTSADIKISYDFGFMTLKSTTAVNYSERVMFQETDGSPSPLLEASTNDDFDSFSQEFLFSGDASDNLFWVVGLYHYSDELDVYQQFSLPSINSGQVARFKTESENSAIFGELTYGFTDRVELTVGARWTRDERSAGGRVYFHNFMVGTYNSPSFTESNELFESASFPENDQDWEEFSGRVSLSYKLENTTLWGTVARGFKGGDINSGAQQSTAVGIGIISDPEYVTSFEIGAKGVLLDDTFQYDVSAYYYQYDDKQVFTAVVPPVGPPVPLNILSNAAELTISGVDGDLTWLASDALSIEVGFAYVNSEFDDYANPLTGADDGRFVGNTTAYTPEISFDVIVSYDIPLDSGASINLQADAVYSDDIFFTNLNDTFVGQESYWLTGARIGFTTADENWNASLWVKNLADEEYFVGGFEFLSLGGTYYGFSGDPRTIGASISYSF